MAVSPLTLGATDRRGGLWLLSGFYMVGPGERGLVLTFGRLTGQSESGLHYRLPAPSNPTLW